MGNLTGNISGQKINIELGDITSKICDAYVVPQFCNCVSEAGVGGAIIRSGAEQGMTAYKNYLDTHGGKLNFGDACLTTSGGGNAKYLLHVVSVDSGKNEEFSTVQKAVYNALFQAQKRGLKSIAMPTLGTGAIGNLTATQCAKAILSAIFQFSKNGGKIDEISIMVFDSEAVQKEFVKVLGDKSYEVAVPEAGQKPLDWNGLAELQAASFKDFLFGGRK